MNVKFEWDAAKSIENYKKHKVTFEEASTIFGSFPFEIFHDPDNSAGEDRFIAMGCSSRGRTLLVVHCENSNGTLIRIISARKATKKETNDVFGGHL
jgi:uncharacterized DUF497 family protein